MVALGNMILGMQNNILPSSGKSPPEGSVAERTVARGLSERYTAARAEVAGLMAAARNIMRESASVDPRVSEIISRAGSSNQAFYRHFRSKDELLLALLDEGLRDLVEHLEARMALARSARGKVERWIAGIVRQATDSEAAQATRPFVANRARLAERFPDEERRSVSLLVEPLVNAIREGVVIGEFDSSDPDHDAEAIYHLAMGWMQSRMFTNEEAGNPELGRLTAFALRGLGA